MKVYVVYQITNTITDKVYIGVHRTEDLEDRYMGSGRLIKRAIRKHGRDAFKKDILYIFEDAESAYTKEAEIVDTLFVKRADTYNMKEGGLGGGHSEETIEVMKQRAIKRSASPVYRQKLSEALLKKWQDPDYLRKRRDFTERITASDQYRINCSNAAKLRWQDPTYREKNIAKKFGREVSENARQKHREHRLGKRMDQITKDKISATLKNRQVSEETRQKMRDAAKNRPTVRCPYCGLERKLSSSFKRWHFDKCKENTFDKR